MIYRNRIIVSSISTMEKNIPVLNDYSFRIGLDKRYVGGGELGFERSRSAERAGSVFVCVCVGALEFSQDWQIEENTNGKSKRFSANRLEIFAQVWLV